MEMTYLEGKVLNPIQDEVLAWLSDLGYVDDLSFALQLVEDRCHYKPCGEQASSGVETEGYSRPFIKTQWLIFMIWWTNGPCSRIGHQAG